MTQRLAVTKFSVPELFAEINRSLPCMNDRRTLVLIQCHNIHPCFESQAQPLKGCPNLEELVLYVRVREEFYAQESTKTARKRASRGARVRPTVVVGLGELVSGKVFKLRERVTPRVGHRIEENPSRWGSILDDEWQGN